MTVRTARCHCGALELACDGEPRKVSLCHCLDCQRRSGAPFSVAAFYARDTVRLTRGDASVYERGSASGHPVRFHFCGRCGSNVWWEPQRMPDLVGVAVGAFADPEFPPPQQAVFARDRHVWVELPEDVPEFPASPPPRPSNS